MNKLTQIKVFIADDHPVVAYGVSCMLSKHENICIIGTAVSGEEMQQRLPKEIPNVLLLDLNMPGKDFYENIAWIRQYVPWVKILAYSGYYSPELVKALLNEGARGYVHKSAQPEELVKAILAVSRGETFVLPAAPDHADHLHNTSNALLQDDFRKRLGLSRREQEILVLISRGLSSQLISQQLYISKYTVETHRKNILRKLDFNSSTELVKFAVQHGLV